MQRFNSFLPRKIDGFFAVAFFILSSQKQQWSSVFDVFARLQAYRNGSVGLFHGGCVSNVATAVLTISIENYDCATQHKQILLQNCIGTNEKRLPYGNNLCCVANWIDFSVKDYPKNLW